MNRSSSESDTPYMPPHERDGRTTAKPPGNVVGKAGFWVSMAGVLGLFAVNGFTGEAIAAIGMSLTFLCVPGAVISALGLAWSPRSFAMWGLGLGMFGILYLPTFFMALFLV